MATLSASSPPARHASVVAPGIGSVAGAIVSLGTALALLGAVVLVLLTPLVTHALLDTAGTPAQAFGGREAAHRLSDATVQQLVFGGDFDVAAPSGASLYTADEQAHLRDARTLLHAFLVVASASAIAVGLAAARRRTRSSAWRAVGRGAAGLTVGVLVVGVVGPLAWELAFEAFHRIFFPGGNWAFDPRSSAMIQLYPMSFWTATTTALGALAMAAGVVTWLVARRSGTR